MSAIRAGMVSVVPLTIIGGLFTIVAYLPVAGWDQRIAPYRPVLQVPVTATFGLLALVACFAIAYDLAKRLGQEAIVSATVATRRVPADPDRSRRARRCSCPASDRRGSSPRSSWR